MSDELRIAIRQIILVHEEILVAARIAHTHHRKAFDACHQLISALEAQGTALALLMRLGDEDDEDEDEPA